MKKIAVLATAVILATMLISLYPMTTQAANGPRTDLDIVWYTTPDAAFTALQNDEIDLMQWGLTKEQKESVEANPNLQIVAFSENGMFEFDFNNNVTIMDYPLNLNPINVKEVRIAIDYLIDTDFIVANILEFFGSRIDAPVAYPQTIGWVNESVVTFDFNGNGVIDPSEDNYPYAYSPDAAAALLASIGFSDTDANGYLNYPVGGMWMGASGIDTTAMPLKIMIRNDHAHRLAAGRYLYGQLEGNPAVAGDSVLALSPAWAAAGKVGGDFDTTDVTWEAPRSVLRTPVFIQFNYHIYTGGWSFGRYPTYLFSLYHSMFSYPGGPNYVTADQHPDLDVYLEGVWYAPNIASAQASAKLATGYIVMNNVMRPLWSYTSYYTWRKELAGVVNMKGVGPVNDYTFLNAYRATNPSAAMRLGVANTWTVLNIEYSSWYFEYALLDRVYTGLINANPYDLAVDIPWLAQDWLDSTWVDGATTKTKVTYYLRKDAGAAAPVTGFYAGAFNAYDLAFTIWYSYAYDDSWQWGSFMDINHIKIIDMWTVEVYFDDVSMWFVYAPTYPLLGPKHILEDQLTVVASATFAAPATEVQFGGTLAIDGVVQVLNATSDLDGALVEGVDYHIRGGYDVFAHNVFVNDGGVTPGATVTIFYTKGAVDGAAGTYLGGNLGYDWSDNMFAYGLYYPISISTTSAALNKNPYFFMETPKLGEVDWRWTFVGSVKPRSGYFKIDILDVVKVTGAYSSRGDGLTNPVYLAGADIDANDLCHIGILDLVTITGKYAETFGEPPTSVLGVGGGTSAMADADETVRDSNVIVYRVFPGPVLKSYHVLVFWPPGAFSANFLDLVGATGVNYAALDITGFTVNTGTGTVSGTATSAAANAIIEYTTATGQRERIRIIQ